MAHLLALFRGALLASPEMELKPVCTPLVSLEAFSTKQTRVLGKLESMQRSRSFKYRGILHLAKQRVSEGFTSLVCSSGGNAGMACAVVGKQLGLKVHVFVPSSTSQFMISLIEKEGAQVIISGCHWAEANDAALKFIAEAGAHACMVHPFDDELLWTGHASIIAEIKTQLQGQRPDAIVLSVGGGGLLLGCYRGLVAAGWEDVRIVACETRGAESLNACFESGMHASLDGIRSVAKTVKFKSKLCCFV